MLAEIEINFTSVKDTLKRGANESNESPKSFN